MRNALFIFTAIALLSCSEQAPKELPVPRLLPKVHVVGALSEVMHQGKLDAQIRFDTLAEREHLYGMGPLEGLQGEFTILDGIPLVARVKDGQCVVNEERAFGAPFAGYSVVEEWTSTPLPNDLRSISDLNTYFDKQFEAAQEPFFFLIEAEIDSATIHVMNLPAHVEPSSPEVIHEQGRVFFNVPAQKVRLLGFYSQNHQGVFTHKGSSTHIHLITADKGMMGHLDRLSLKGGKASLSVPVNLKLSPSQPV